MPIKSNNTGGQGGKRPGAGRKLKGVKEKADNGNYEGTAGKIKNDNMTSEKFYDFLFDAFSCMEALFTSISRIVCRILLIKIISLIGLAKADNIDTMHQRFFLWCISPFFGATQIFWCISKNLVQAVYCYIFVCRLPFLCALKLNLLHIGQNNICQDFHIFLLHSFLRRKAGKR